jgi:hypothetical protein
VWALSIPFAKYLHRFFSPLHEDLFNRRSPEDHSLLERAVTSAVGPPPRSCRADSPQLEPDPSAAHEWVKKLVTMAEFVNGTGSESLNSEINQLEIKNSIPFRGVVRREEKRITKLAENLRGLAEVLKSVIITSEKKVKDATSPR